MPARYRAANPLGGKEKRLVDDSHIDDQAQKADQVIQAPVLAQNNPSQAVTQPPPSERQRAPSPFGLSKSHIGPQYVLIGAVGGNLLSVVTRGAGAPPPSGAKRGEIHTFSKKSRLRLLRLFASINKTANGGRPPLTVTLTYPAEYPAAKASKAQLRAMNKRIQRKYPGAATIWRIERQGRGAPHFHLTVFGPSFIPWQWVARAWFEVVDSGDEKHLDAGTEVRRVRNWREAGAYFSKYMAKREEIQMDRETGEIITDDLGRSWGIMGRENLPVELAEELLDVTDWDQARRIILRYLRSKGVQAKVRGRFQGVHAFTGEESFRMMKRIIGL